MDGMRFGRSRRRSALFGLIGLVLVLVAAACSSDDESSSSAPAPTTTAAAAPEAPAAPEAAEPETPATTEAAAAPEAPAAPEAAEPETPATTEAAAEPETPATTEAAAPPPEENPYVAGNQNCSKTAGITDDEIVVGFIAGFSGPYGFYAQNNASGLDAYVAEINSAGGIDGRQITVQRMDHEYNPEVAVSRFEELEPDVAFLLSHGTQPTNQILPLTEDSCMPTVVMGQGGINALSPNTTIYSTPNAYMALNALEWAATERGATGKWGIIYQQDVAGDEILTAIRFGVDFLGLDLAAETSFAPGDSNFTAQIREMRDAGVEWVLLGAFPTPSIQIIGEAVAQGADFQFTGPAVSWGGEVSFSQADQTALADQVGLTQSSYTSGWAASNDPALEAAKEIIRRHSDIEGQVPLLGYSGGTLLVEILQAASNDGDLSRGAIVNAIPKVGEIDLRNLFCGVSFGEPGQPRNPSRSSMIMSISADNPPDGYVLEKECFTGTAAAVFELEQLG